MAPVRLEPPAPRSRVEHSTTEPLRSLSGDSVAGIIPVSLLHCHHLLFHFKVKLGTVFHTLSRKYRVRHNAVGSYFKSLDKRQQMSLP